MMRAVEAHSCRRHSPAGQCGAPFFCALDALAINDRSARAGVPPRQLPACHIERVVNAPERAVVVPSVEVVVQGAARRQVLGDRGPLAACAQDVHEAVGYLAQVDRPLVAAALGGRDQWGDQRPFLVGQVTWVAQLATVVATTVLTRPHQWLPPDRNAAKEITTNSKDSRCSRMDTQRRAAPPHRPGLQDGLLLALVRESAVRGARGQRLLGAPLTRDVGQRPPYAARAIVPRGKRPRRLRRLGEGHQARVERGRRQPARPFATLLRCYVYTRV